jgi:uncharacterized glyoxalase superfamily protein PhnB
MPEHRFIPALRYRDATAAVEWLCRAFGFERHFVVPGEDGRVVHAQLTGEGGMVMLGQASDHAYDEHVKPPAEVGGICTQAAYVIVDDCKAHHDRAVAAGAEVVVELREEPYGGWAYSCRDPEGHVWSFGEYDPWA